MHGRYVGSVLKDSEALRRGPRFHGALVLAAALADVVPKLLSNKNLIIVVGDADVIVSALSRFGEVTVVAPTRGILITKTIPSAAAQ